MRLYRSRPRTRPFRGPCRPQNPRGTGPAPPAAPAGRQVADATGTSRIGALQSHSSVT
ncbi:hypothetical protein GCM10018953_30710 [Streptosporangium nondiastaticum]